MWVYKQTEPELWTVGFYDPNGKWHPESDHGSPEEAARRVHYLNGGREIYIKSALLTTLETCERYFNELKLLIISLLEGERENA